MASEESLSARRGRATLRGSELRRVCSVTALRPLGVCVVVCAAIMLTVAVADAAFPGANGRIAYTSWIDDVCHSSRPDGTRQRRILQCRRPNSLKYSADGRRIVVAGGGERASLSVARADGRERSWLVRGGLQASGAHWAVHEGAFSPDGSQVAFGVLEEIPDPAVSDGERIELNVYVVGIDGVYLRLIARGQTGGAMFSPDGRRITYIAWHGRRQAVETIAVDGTDRRTLVWDTGGACCLDSAPDGSRLMLVEPTKRRGDAGGRIVIFDALTGERTRLPLRVTRPVWDAVWSPDGRRIAFVHLDSNRVFTIRPDGTGKRLAFTARVGGIERLAWQPRP
jgi:Tol biopolymer transport system component